MQGAVCTSECLPTQRVRGVCSQVEPPKKGKGKAKAGGGGGGGGSSSKPKATDSSGEASTSQQASGQRSTQPSAAGAAGQEVPPATEPALHWTQIKIPPAPTSGTPHEMQAARKERQRVRRLYEAARLRAGE